MINQDDVSENIENSSEELNNERTLEDYLELNNKKAIKVLDLKEKIAFGALNNYNSEVHPGRSPHKRPLSELGGNGIRSMHFMINDTKEELDKELSISRKESRPEMDDTYKFAQYLSDTQSV